MSSLDDDDAPPREPILDTWTWKGDGAAWVASLPVAPGNSASVNAACAGVIAGVLDDFAPLARVYAVTLVCDAGPVRLQWQAGEPNASFRARAIEAIRELPQPIMEAQLALDLRVWFRTKDAEAPVLAWLRAPHTELVLALVDDGTRAAVMFEVTNTLFSAFTHPYAGEANPLHALDQPLLEAALRRFAARSSEELQVMGELAGACPTGFSSDRDDY